MNSANTLLNDENDFYDETFTGLDLPKAALSGKQFEACTFEKVHLAGATISRCTFLDCRFVDCDLSSATVVNTSFRDTTFVGSKLVGIDWSTANTNMGFDVRFEDCVLDYCSFSRLHLHGLVIADSRAHDANFDESVLKGAVFEGADLQGSSMRRADLRKANLAGAVGVALELSTCQLADTTVSLECAQDSLSLIGVTIGKT